MVATKTATKGKAGTAKTGTKTGTKTAKTGTKNSTRGRRPASGTLAKPKDTDESETSESLDNKAEESKPVSTVKAQKTAVKPTAVAKPAPASDAYTKSVKFFSSIKPTSDLYVRVNYQSLSVDISPSVKSEFFQVLADGAKAIGFIYQQNGRSVYIYGVTPNYDINSVLDAIEKAAGLYGLKTEVIGGMTVPSEEDIQRRITGIVHSLLPPATIG